MDGDVSIFVYGTLRSGASNHWRMEGGALLGTGVVRGELYRIGWYPGLILRGNGLVRGEVYEVSADKLHKLDIFEGCAEGDPEPHEYRRVRVMVGLDDGSELEAWAWEYIAPLGDREPIPGGDWLER